MDDPRPRETARSSKAGASAAVGPAGQPAAKRRPRSKRRRAPPSPSLCPVGESSASRPGWHDESFPRPIAWGGRRNGRGRTSPKRDATQVRVTESTDDAESKRAHSTLCRRVPTQPVRNARRTQRTVGNVSLPAGTCGASGMPSAVWKVPSRECSATTHRRGQPHVRNASNAFANGSRRSCRRESSSRMSTIAPPQHFTRGPRKMRQSSSAESRDLKPKRVRDSRRTHRSGTPGE